MRRLPLRSPLRMRGKGPDDRAHPLVPGITPACAGKRKPHLHKKGCTWDHPRVCGEKLVRLMCCRCLAGSPPRMRGKAPRIREDLERMGITPAYAGKSCGLSFFVTPCRDHPRVCGEKYQAGEAARQSQGSPPRMRGKVSAEDFKPQTGGDHPRVCGEKPLQSSVNCTMEGLPPRVRGKVFGRVRCYRAVGITPAYAGKRTSSRPTVVQLRDHPRVCGEKHW